LPSQGAGRAAVVDSSAVLAVLLSEPGGDKVIAILEGGLLSTVNLAEVHAHMISLGAAAPHAWERILSLQCEFCPLTEAQARITAELVPTTRPFGLSLGDRACLALALDRKATVYTADHTWKNLNLGIEIEVIR
jgi:ribonuclease VapC